MLHQIAWAWNSEAFGHILAGNIRRRKYSRPPFCTRGTVAPKLQEFTKIYPLICGHKFQKTWESIGVPWFFHGFSMVFLPGLDDGGMLVEAGIGRKDLNQPPIWWLKRATAWIDDDSQIGNHPNLWDEARLTFTFFWGGLNHQPLDAEASHGARSSVRGCNAVASCARCGSGSPAQHQEIKIAWIMYPSKRGQDISLTWQFML